jgi:hypothetical protein
MRLRFLNPVALAVSLAALSGSLIGSGAAGWSAPADALARSAQFKRVGTHPQASLQPTDRGRKLNFLKHWNGAIYAGYGDYGTNTGPIAITPFSRSRNRFAARPAFWANSEELQVFRALNGRLYAPSIDPIDRILPDDYFERPLAGPWIGRNVVDAVHVFDVAVRAGSELWMAGAAGENAVVWRSLDGGATWSSVLAIPPMNSGDFARFHFLGVHHDEVHVQATDFFAGKHPGSKVFNGSEWSDGPDLLPQGGVGYDIEPFDGRLVYLAFQSSPSSLLSFDGATVRSNGPILHNYSIAGVTLYGLGQFGRITKTTNLSRWRTLKARAPKTARSIVVVKRAIYVGTIDSRIYRLSR